MTRRPRRVVHVRCEWHLIDHVTGLWCAVCNLPSGHEARYVLTYRDNPAHTLCRAVVRLCTDCGATLAPQVSD